MKKKFIDILRFLPIVVCVLVVLCYFLFGRNISIDTIVNYAPENQLLAALFLILLYGIKSLSVFFPIIILNVVGGFLFSPVLALIVNSIGVVVELIIPYWIGRLSDSELSKRLVKKYPKVKELLDYQHNTPFFVSFFLRVIACLPGDAISMYLGSKKISFGIYLLGSFLGMLPNMVIATLLGTSITEPSSPMFWFSIILTLVLSVVSIIVYAVWMKRKKEKV